jgi:hypothetical protein
MTSQPASLKLMTSQPASSTIVGSNSPSPKRIDFTILKRHVGLSLKQHYDSDTHALYASRCDPSRAVTAFSFTTAGDMSSLTEWARLLEIQKCERTSVARDPRAPLLD